MARKGPREWSPRRKFQPPSTPEGVELEGWLQSVTILDGEGEIDLGRVGPVYVAIVDSGGSYFPTGVIVVDQNPYHGENNVLEIGFEMVKEDVMKNKEYVKELQRDWGDEWEEILTENFGGKVWSFNDPYQAAAAIATNKRAFLFIDLEESEESRR